MITVSFHNFKSQNFELSVSNPKSKYVAYVSVLSQMLNCQGLGRKNNHDILKTDRNSYTTVPWEGRRVVLPGQLYINIILCTILYIYICIYIYTVMCTCVYTYIYIYIYIYTYIHVYIYIYTHEYTIIYSCRDGVWYFPRNWLHGFACISPEGCEVYRFVMIALVMNE